MAPHGEPRAAGKQRGRASVAGRAVADAAVRRRRASVTPTPSFGAAPRPAACGRDTLFRRGDACVAAFIVQTGVVRLVEDDHGGDLADEHVEFRKKTTRVRRATAALRDARRRFGRRASSSMSVSTPGRRFPAGASSSSGTTTTSTGHRVGVARGRRAGPRRVRVRGVAAPRVRRRLAVLGVGGGVAAPGWVSVWGLGMKASGRRRGAVDDERHRFAALLRGELRRARRLDRAAAPPRGGRAGRGDVRERRAHRGAAPSADGVFVVTRGVAQEETPFRASGADDISRAGRESSIRRSRGSDVSSARLLRRGDVFGTDGVFDGGTRERSVVAGGGVGARVSCAVWRPAALAQLGFLRRALEEFQRRA